MPFWLMYWSYRCRPVELTSVLSLCVKKQRLWCSVEWVLQGAGSKKKITQSSCETQVPGMGILLLGSFLGMCKECGFLKQKILRLVLAPRVFQFSLCLALCLGRIMSCLQVWFNAGHGDLGMEIPLLFNMMCLPLSATLKIYSLLIKINEGV